MPGIKLPPATSDLLGSVTSSPDISSLLTSSVTSTPETSSHTFASSISSLLPDFVTSTPSISDVFTPGIPGVVEAVPDGFEGSLYDLQGTWPQGGWPQPLTQGGSWPGKGTVDLSVLWKMLEQHKEEQRQQTEQVKVTAENQMDATWEMVVIQGVLLTILVLMSVCWAFCCKKKCFCLRAPLVDEVVAIARKISSGSTKDLPPSYSKLDLNSLELSVQDYLYPPPTYLEICNDSLQYLDLELGSRRTSRASLGGSDLEARPRLSVASRDSVTSRDRRIGLMEDGGRRISLMDDGGRRISLMDDRGARLSVASCSSCHSQTPVLVSLGAARPPSLESRRSSRVSFCEDVNVSNGSIRRLSNNSLILSSKSSKSNSASSSRSTSVASSRRSSCSETSSRRLSSDGGSQKHSFLEVRRASRKVSPPFPSRKVSPPFHSRKTSPPQMTSSLDEELRSRLAKVEEDVDAIRVLPELIEEEEK